MIWESNMVTYITMCKIHSQWEFAGWLRELKKGLCINLEGWFREGDGREFQEGKDIENRLMDMGKGEERVRCKERVTWKLILPYKLICR